MEGFSRRDREILRELMWMLGDREATALILRYWKNCDIAEVATEMGLTWPQANELIERAQGELKHMLLKHRGFSRR